MGNEYLDNGVKYNDFKQINSVQRIDGADN